MADAIEHYKRAEKAIEDYQYQAHRINELESETDLAPAEQRELEALYDAIQGKLKLGLIHATLATTKYTGMDLNRPVLTGLGDGVGPGSGS